VPSSPKYNRLHSRMISESDGGGRRFRTVDGRHNLCRAATIGFLVASILPTHAQNFPSGNITIVVPAAPGGGHDAVARVMGQKLRARLGWTIIVENRGGANGMIAAEAVAKSRPDGRTILVSTPANNYIGPELRKDMRFNPARDLAQVTLPGVTPIVLPRRGPDHRPTKWRSLR
jgi:tripartite-type tricarboxylate transporter receptor subunit TctC